MPLKASSSARRILKWGACSPGRAPPSAATAWRPGRRSSDATPNQSSRNCSRTFWSTGSTEVRRMRAMRPPFETSSPMTFP